MKDYYNKLSEDYDSLYIQNILEFQKRQLEINKEDNYYVDFYPSLGIKNSETTEFLVCGQAVNGWSSGFGLYEKIDQIKLLNSIKSSNKYLSEKNHTPIDWVNFQWSNSIYNDHCKEEIIRNFYDGTYRAYRSFFWNVTYKLICDYYNIDRRSFNWSKKLVWSNLYKIAPEDANPNWFERELQQPLSSELLKKEIEELNPRFCVVLTNLDWWLPFRERIQTKIIEYDNSLDEIVSLEYYFNTKIIVTNRPKVAKSDKFVEQILELIKK